MVPGRLTHGMNEGGQIHLRKKRRKKERKKERKKKRIEKEKNKNFTTLLLSVPSAC